MFLILLLFKKWIECKSSCYGVVVVNSAFLKVGVQYELAHIVGVHGMQFPITAIREIKILKKLQHSNVIKLKEIVTSKGTYSFHLLRAGSNQRGHNCCAQFI